MLRTGVGMTGCPVVAHASAMSTNPWSASDGRTAHGAWRAGAKRLSTVMTSTLGKIADLAFQSLEARAPAR